MTEEPPEHKAHPSTLELIDIAVSSAKHAAHCCRNQTTRDLFEFALALLRESWIAESGQEARKPLEVVSDVQQMTAIFAAVFNQQQQQGGN
jgi:hypothetical protein